MIKMNEEQKTKFHIANADIRKILPHIFNEVENILNPKNAQYSCEMKMAVKNYIYIKTITVNIDEQLVSFVVDALDSGMKFNFKTVEFAKLEVLNVITLGELYDLSIKTKKESENKEMTKEELVGNIVELRNGEKFLVMPNGIMYNKNFGYMALKEYDESLLRYNNKISGWDIVKVFDCNSYIKAYPFDYINKMKVLWEREEVKQPTKKDIEIMKAYNLIYDCKYFVKDKNGCVFGYESKPEKNNVFLDWRIPYSQNHSYGTVIKKQLSHLSWEDDEPYYFKGE